MAEVLPFRALHYDLERAGGLEAVVSPPYDVIDPEQRAELAGRSPVNVVEIDLPESYDRARELFAEWQRDGVLVRDDEDALWALEQDYTGPDGERYRRHGFFARVTVTDYGPGKVRPHERTHPGPREDRLRLTRATQANLSPIFSLYDDPEGGAWGALAPHLAGEPWGEVTDPDGTEHRLWRIADRDALAAVTGALADRELLIADGHHRYETARVFHTEEGGAGHVLMCLVALQDPGLTVFPTHRLLVGLEDASRTALREAIERDWDARPVDRPFPAGDRLEIGYQERGGQPQMLTLKDPATADRALEGFNDAYRRLDTAVLEALILKGALGMTEDDISHLNGLAYSRSDDEALKMLETGEADAAFFMGPTPVERVRDVAAGGENMPPKSTYFFPKILTGLLFNPLD